jgi:hypothetical protein
MTNPSRSASNAREARSGVSLNFDDIAPIASKRQESVQSSSSPPPANMTSCWPSATCCAAMPMQWSEVEQAEVMEKFIPLIR